VFLKVADENGFTAAGLEETTPLFAKPPENHRQCPAGGFSFWPRPTAFAADTRLLRFALIATEKRLPKITVNIKSSCKPLLLLLSSLLRRGNPLCSSSLQAQ